MGIIISKPAQQNSSGDVIDAMQYELAGIISVTYVLKTFGASEMERFSKEGHPSVINQSNFFEHKVAPNFVLRILQEEWAPHFPFGIFFATQESNPDCNRPLIAKADIEIYRREFQAVYFNPDWKEWDDVITQYKSRCIPGYSR